MSDASRRHDAPPPAPSLPAIRSLPTATRVAVTAVTAVTFACVGSLAGCREKTEPPAPAASAAPPRQGPVDHLAPGELIDGEGLAFGLALPRGLTVVSRISGKITGETEAPPEHVANYFRARVADGKITVGTTSTQFVRVRAKANPSRELDIRVEQTRNGSRVEVMDVTRPTGPTPSSSAEALKEVGLDPNGKPSKQME